ncbi:hypothetical protein J5J86_23505 [Aquabacter sp. L1I39]|uniref:hypothetical protein n=1 Tax=Aquabacter sp. L1I39 TaxID=2820278 RepID=UPI001ADACD50|nr:hypothetical protein [Aquabacter sp. L1I39]QTL03653.1 hypothetical protein J5J86_23505 [Aquabacter sp. L1I39]
MAQNDLSAQRNTAHRFAEIKRRTDERIPVLMAHPRFHEAMEIATRGILDMYHGNRLLNRLMNDRGRVIFGLLCYYLASSPDENGVGLTVTRIADICEETNLCSRGRAKALITLMRWAGYVDACTSGAAGNRRQRPLVPTPRMTTEYTRRWKTMLTAISRFDSVADEALARLSEPGFLTALVRNQGDRYRAGFRLLEHSPQMEVLAERDAGVLIAISLYNSGGEGDTYPPSQPVPVPVAGLARQFDVSRAHVLKMLREAEDAGLIRRLPAHQGTVELLPPLLRGVEYFMAACFSLQLDCATDALQQCGAAPTGGAEVPPHYVRDASEKTAPTERPLTRQS